MTDVLNIVVAGDLVLDEPDAGHWLAGIAPAVRAADLAIAHLEVPHTRRGQELQGDVPAPGAPPENVAAIAEAGFDIVTLAGNHISDCGAEGIEDTLRYLDDVGVGHAGAGANLVEARKPAFTKGDGVRIAVLSYNCVGPAIGWATEDRAGSAYLRVETSDGSPIAPAAPLEHVSDEALQILESDIATVRGDANLVLVALHKGIVHVPARLAPYERPLAHAAIDAGADAVLGHHAHIIRGIEFRRGRPIFHGLGNACVVTSALSPAQDHPARREWAERRKRMFGFEPDPAYTLAPFHPEAVNAFLGRIVLTDTGEVRAGIIPVHVEAPGRPILADAQRASEIRNYVEKITRDAGLPPIIVGDDNMIRLAA
ncbi:CapA family protein [Sphingomonas piscis]|uniref:CapA family protein n=1 Tax=Sphingomonas piscis TaxID=2714943 RepID=A0A6G7YM41_9SPHN|nr:CapA family protein [Sphingomonas piscis]QIK77809.1 CapA family protein [Sphingomonas piscis]